MTLHPIYGAQIKMKKVEKQLHTHQMNTLLKQDSNERKTVLKKISGRYVHSTKNLVIVCQSSANINKVYN